MKSQLFQTLADLAGLPKGGQLSPRDEKILAHYENQVSRGWMDILSASERAEGDLLGQNRHQSKSQRNAPSHQSPASSSED